ncbi:unnamed protein product [Phytomonas sp. Hart1]|nr:unnamed protein product [Phytomonas sp. Hart1]|eukprot:CCW71545.1 unnamed protein product [Phytomonas sp. isolate Hart1]
MLKRVSEAASRVEVDAADNVRQTVEGMAVAKDSISFLTYQDSDSDPSQLLLHKHGRIGMSDNLKANFDSVACVNPNATETCLNHFSSTDEISARALVSYNLSLNGALSPFSGIYDDVSFPLKTLFFPPAPPNEFPPRVAPPRNLLTPVWKNDLRKAGLREQQAQTMISKIWRGIMCRRQQRVIRVHQSVLNQRARVIQCWWRTFLARRRNGQLLNLKNQWIEKRTNDYVAERLTTMQNMMTWQRSRYDGAATRLQRVIRWFLRERERDRCLRVHSLPEEEWPPALKFPIAIKRIIYFPWRPRNNRLDDDLPSDSLSEGRGELAELNQNPFDFSPGSHEGHPQLSTGAIKTFITGKRTLLQFRKTRDLIVPMSWDRVQAANQASERQAQEQALALAHPFVQSRLEWKQGHLDGYDLDFGAGVIQRRYRSQRSTVKLHTTQLRHEFMDRVVRIISRTFRMYILIKRMRENSERNKRRLKSKMDVYTRERIGEIDREMVWGKELLNMSAATIQSYWHWYLYRTRGEMPKRRHTPPTLGDDADPESVAFLKKLQEVTTPMPPPFHLIDSFIEKERTLLMESMNLIERNRIRREKNHRYTEFIPQRVNRYQINVHLA